VLTESGDGAVAVDVLKELHVPHTCTTCSGGGGSSGSDVASLLHEGEDK
jgi:hypothetical protein